MISPDLSMILLEAVQNPNGEADLEYLFASGYECTESFHS